MHVSTIFTASRIWFSLHTLHYRVLSLHRCQTVVIEIKPATYVLKVIPDIPLIMPGQLRMELILQRSLKLVKH